jgi:hypothetical protein
MQNFSEDYMVDYILAGEVPFRPVTRPSRSSTPTTSRTAVAALTDDSHRRALRAHRPTAPTFATPPTRSARRRSLIQYAGLYRRVRGHRLRAEVPTEVVELLSYLFAEVPTDAMPI